ncbi:MAG: spore coat protein [Clostridiales bacterium]|jgi:spore coat protein F|nr:spore coat protein [Clostridiales bacterium]
MDTGYFGDREILIDLLLSEKQLSSSYNTCVNESTGEAFGHILENLLNETHRMRLDILKAIQKRGWHKTRNASSQDIEMLKRRFATPIS